MNNIALAYSSPVLDPRRAFALRKKHVAAPRKPRPWSEVTLIDVRLNAASGHPGHIKRSQLATLTAVALLVHGGIAWYFAKHISHRAIEMRKSELSIELVRPPKPIEPQRVEPPKPVAQKPRSQPAQVLPQIQQSDPIPSSDTESHAAPVAVAPIVAAPSAQSVEPVTAPIGRAGYLNNPPPDYPAQAVKQGWQGTVLLRVHVLASGKVEDVEVKQSSGRKLLDDEAIRTVKRWLFTPSKRGDSPIDGWAVVPIEFLLDQ